MKPKHLNTGAHVFPQEEAKLVFGVGADFEVLKGRAAEVRKDEVCIHTCLVKLEDVVLLHAGKLALVVGIEGLGVGVDFGHKEIDGAGDGVSVEVRDRVGDDSGGNHQVRLLVVETALCLKRWTSRRNCCSPGVGTEVVMLLYGTRRCRRLSM